MATLKVELDSPIPIADQIVNGLRAAIATGQLKPDDTLPPVRQLAADLGVNLNTVARAYRELETAGLVSTVRGRGTRLTSSREKGKAAKVAADEVRKQLAHAAVDAKLAGMSREKVTQFFEEIVASFYSESTG